MAEDVAGTRMAHYDPFEIHVHGEISRIGSPLPGCTGSPQTLWQYAGAKSLEDGGISSYEEEPGIQYDQRQNLLRICWTVRGKEDFRQNVDDMCMNLNELASTGAAIEVTPMMPNSMTTPGRPRRRIARRLHGSVLSALPGSHHTQVQRGCWYT